MRDTLFPLPGANDEYTIARNPHPLRGRCLPDVAEHLAADALVVRLLARHDAARGGEDGGAEAAHDARNMAPTCVDAQAGAAHPLEAHDDRLLVRRVLERD